MLQPFKSLPVWEHYEQKKTRNINLEEIFGECSQRLKLFFKAFPKYTLHDDQHLYNILRIIGELLGPNIALLNELEATLIILSVAYHDIGMVFSDEELSRIAGEPGFTQYLDSNYRAKLEFVENDGHLTSDLAQEYCRWTHAKRVWLYVGELDSNPWGAISLKKAVGDIAESHNSSANSLIDDEKFSTEFLGADLRFCSIMLRLGDILDFDRTRSPKSLYEFLELDSPKNRLDELSKIEWNKHLATDGFRISSDGQKSTLKIIAGPTHPQVLQNIDKFLDIVDRELGDCNRVLQYCSPKWRDVRLPEKVDRGGVIPQNFKRGNFSLSLDERQVVKLLVGENLYGNGLVFLRELLQNAIDASRMREYYEKTINGNPGFKSRPISVRFGRDSEGFAWIEVKDYGMGISKYVLENYLLKKGNSYYSSDHFKLLQFHFKRKGGATFRPISRFGIGLLSCFMLGDQIQIDTKAIGIAEPKSDEISMRLSIESLDGQYILQTSMDRHVPISMPLDSGLKGFREDYGTTVAVRIDRNLDVHYLETAIERSLDEYITASPIEVDFNGRRVGLDFDEIFGTDIAKDQVYAFDAVQKDIIESILGDEADTFVGVRATYINLGTANVNNLKGHVVTINPELNLRVGLSNNFDYQINVSDKKKATLKISKRYFNEERNRYEDKEALVDISHFVKDVFVKNYLDKIFGVSYHSFSSYHNGIYLIHNGVNVPNLENEVNRQPKLELRGQLFGRGSIVPGLSRNISKIMTFALVYLQDNLIPDLAISRDAIRKIGFSIFSALYFATKKFNQFASDEIFYNYFENVQEVYTFWEVIRDEQVVAGRWDNEKIFFTSIGRLSLNELRSNQKLDQLLIKIERGSSFLGSLSASLLQRDFNVAIKIIDGRPVLLIMKGQALGFSDSAGYLQPLQFLIFHERNDILSCGSFINRGHILGEWLVNGGDYLWNNFKSYYLSLINRIINRRADEVNIILKNLNSRVNEKVKPPTIFVSIDELL